MFSSNLCYFYSCILPLKIMSWIILSRWLLQGDILSMELFDFQNELLSHVDYHLRRNCQSKDWAKISEICFKNRFSKNYYKAFWVGYENIKCKNIIESFRYNGSNTDSSHGLVTSIGLFFIISALSLIAFVRIYTQSMIVSLHGSTFLQLISKSKTTSRWSRSIFKASGCSGLRTLNKQSWNRPKSPQSTIWTFPRSRASFPVSVQINRWGNESSLYSR